MEEDNSYPLEKSLVLFAIFLKDCHLKFNSTPIFLKSIDGNNYQLDTKNGITHILLNRVPSSAQEPKLNFSKIIQISEYDKSDNSQNDLDTFTSQLKSLSSKLISAVEDVCDLHILHSIFKWGCTKSSFYLLDVEGFYTPNSQLLKFADILPQILFFLSYEIAKKPQFGVCYSEKNSCQGSSMNILRSKIFLAHSNQFISKYTNYPNPELENYLKHRIQYLCPTLLMESIPVCSQCFHFFSIQKSQREQQKNLDFKGKMKLYSTIQSKHRSLNKKNLKVNNDPIRYSSNISITSRNGQYPQISLQEKKFSRTIFGNDPISYPKAQSRSHVQNYSTISVKRATHIYLSQFSSNSKYD